MSFNQLMVTSGILVVDPCHLLLQRGSRENWRWMLGLGALPGPALAIGRCSRFRICYGG